EPAMPRRHASTALGDLSVLFDGGAVARLSDAQLLRRYAPPRAEAARAPSAAQAALAALVHRHGPMGWAACRDILGDAHEAEDAFQATFLVVARRAGSAPADASLGRWIYGVARRVALRARARARKRAVLIPPAPEPEFDEAERAAVLAELG